nr:immunoglobulin heavy chain junction region [Macaca mulatta]MOV48943.1 immunoglobulin heavy chain junction region [Macaca mulatta]MOV52567.1 immunoglobulin heavy chain junction region [Macaca mulatta]
CARDPGSHGYLDYW